MREREGTMSSMWKKGSCDRMERGRTGDNDRSVGKEKKKEGVT